MPDPDLRAIWAVLQTVAEGPDSGMDVVESGVEVSAGMVLLGVDNLGRRLLLIPLRLGEAFGEDRTGRAVHLIRVTYQETAYLCAICIQADLNEEFARFVSELLPEVVEAHSPAHATLEVLDRWKRLFSDAESAGLLSEQARTGHATRWASDARAATTPNANAPKM